MQVRDFLTERKSPHVSRNQVCFERSTSKPKTVKNICIDTITRVIVSPKQQTVKSRNQNYFNKVGNNSFCLKTQNESHTPKNDTRRLMTSPDHNYNSLAQDCRVISQIQTSKAEKQDLGEFYRIEKSLTIQLRLETQSRQAFQLQIHDLKQIILEDIVTIQTLQEQINTHKLRQNDREQQANSRQFQPDKKNNEIIEVFQKCEILLREQISLKDQLKSAQLKIQELQSVIKQQVQRSRTHNPTQSPQRINLSPKFQEQNQQKQNQRLEDMLDISKKNNQNIQKALDLKIAEQQEKETYLQQKIERLQQQLRSKNFFEQDAKQKKQLEQQLQELNQSLQVFQKQVKQHNASTQIIKNSHVTELKLLHSQIEANQSKMQDKDKVLKQQIQIVKSQQIQLELLSNDQTQNCDKTSQTKIQELLLESQNLRLENQQLLQKFQDLNTSNNNNQKLIEQISIGDGNLVLQIDQETQTVQFVPVLDVQTGAMDRLFKDSAQQTTIDESDNHMRKQEIQTKALMIDIKNLNHQIALLEKKNLNPDSSWIAQLNLIKTQAQDVDTKIQSFHHSDEQNDLFGLETQNYDIIDQLAIFESDMNDGLSKQIQETKRFLQDLNSLIMKN